MPKRGHTEEQILRALLGGFAGGQAEYLQFQRGGDGAR
jgi:hypothetical protein